MFDIQIGILKTKMSKKICPQCKSEEVVMPRGDGILYRCVNCSYEASIFPELEKIKNKKKKIIRRGVKA